MISVVCTYLLYEAWEFFSASWTTYRLTRANHIQLPVLAFQYMPDPQGDLDLRPNLGHLNMMAGYENISLNYCVDNVNAYVRVLLGGLTKHVKRTDLYEMLRGVAPDTMLNVQAGGFATVVKPVHRATVQVALVSLYPYIDGMFKNLRFVFGRSMLPEERSYWIGRFCIEKIITHLNSKIEYVKDGNNLMHTACAIFYSYLALTNRPRPILDICNQFGEEEIDSFFTEWEHNPILIANNMWEEAIVEKIHFQYPFAGHVSLEDTSMV